MKIVMGSDHAGYHLKEVLKKKLLDAGHEVTDVGCYNTDSVDYPDIADAVAEEMLKSSETKGVLVCGSGIGISMEANRHRHIRCALVHDGYSARLCREHNDANAIAFGGRLIGEELAADCLDVFLKTAFIPKESYVRRVKKLGKEG